MNMENPYRKQYCISTADEPMPTTGVPLPEGQAEGVESRECVKPTAVITAQRSESVARHPLVGLYNEIDCRIEHGAESGGHLEYVRQALKVILEGGA